MMKMQRKILTTKLLIVSFEDHLNGETFYSGAENIAKDCNKHAPDCETVIAWNSKAIGCENMRPGSMQDAKLNINM